MRISEFLRVASLFTTWKKSSSGYTMTLKDGRVAKVQKSGKKWVLIFEGKEYNLGRKPSFDHAEGALDALLHGRPIYKK